MEFKVGSLDLVGKIVTIFVLLLILTISLFFSVRVPYGIAFVLLLISIPLIAYLLAPKKYYIDGSNIIIEKVIGKKIILPLKNVQACTIIQNAAKLKLVRTFGNGGLFAYYGIFSSAQYGSINFQVTKWRDIILIKTDKFKYAISPANPHDFLERINTYCPSINKKLESFEEPYTQPITKPQLIILIIPTVIFLVTIIIGIILFLKLPDRIAIHFDLRGNPDRWGSRNNYIFGNMMPAMIVFILNIIMFSTMSRALRNPKILNTLVLVLSSIQLLIFYVLADTYHVNIYFSHILPIGTVLIMFGVIMIFLGLKYYQEVKK